MDIASSWRVAALAVTVIVAACVQTVETAESAVLDTVPNDTQMEVSDAGVTSPLIEGARWHHVHINAVDPALSAAYYERHFDAEVDEFPGVDAAVRAQNVWVLFDKVRTPASTAKNTAIWHIGWGAPDPLAEYERQKELGADFYQPVTDISLGMARIPPGRFYYMYLSSPDGTLIELNTAPTNDFGHIHMFSADPIAAGDWFIKMFGVKGRSVSGSETDRSVARAKSGIQIGPSSSHMFDQVNMIIYPQEYSQTAFRADWSGIDALQSTAGGVNDHIGISVPDLDEALTRLKAHDVTILRPSQNLGGGTRHAFIQGPDALVIELLELP